MRVSHCVRVFGTNLAKQILERQPIICLQRFTLEGYCLDNEIDIIEYSVAKSNKQFILSTVLWDSFDDAIRSILHSNDKWQEVKFFDDNGGVSNEINMVPNDAGGIYIFVARPGILPCFHNYFMYIGKSRNLRRRLRDYYSEKKNINKRPLIRQMLNGWGKYLHVLYLPLYGFENTVIEKIEAELINKILPPFNDQIPDKTIRDVVKMFS